MTSLTRYADEIIELFQRAAGVFDRHGKLHAPKGLGKNSGRFVAKSGVRAPLANATSITDVNNAVAAEVKRITRRTATIDLKGADLQVARELGEGVLRGLEHAPTTTLTEVRTYGPSGARKARRYNDEDEGEYANAQSEYIGRTRTTEIGFNVRWMSKPDKLRATLAAEAEETNGIRDSVPAAAGPMGIAAHEFGHVAASQVPKTHEKVTRDARGNVISRSLVGVDLEANDLVIARKDLTGNKDMNYHDFVGQQISSFASWKPRELVAEAFADVVLHRDNARELSKTIYNMVVRGAG